MFTQEEMDACFRFGVENPKKVGDLLYHSKPEKSDELRNMEAANAHYQIAVHNGDMTARKGLEITRQRLIDMGGKPMDLIFDD